MSKQTIQELLDKVIREAENSNFKVWETKHFKGVDSRYYLIEWDNFSMTWIRDLFLSRKKVEEKLEERGFKLLLRGEDYEEYVKPFSDNIYLAVTLYLDEKRRVKEISAGKERITDITSWI